MTLSSPGYILRKFYDVYVEKRDQALLNLVFHPAPTQSDLDEALEMCDIEALGGYKSLMLSYFMRAHPELKFSSYAKPRLHGLINYYRFANIETLSHFAKIGKALNASQIPMVLFKGAAMKTLRPGLSRPMGDVDIIIPHKHMSHAVNICRDMGYHDAMTGSPNAVDIHTADNKGAVDIHSSILEGGKNSADYHRGLWARAKEVETFGVRVYLPSHEDLLFIVLSNLAKNLREKTSLHSLFFALLDVHFLLADKPNFDWTIVQNNSRDLSSELPVRFAGEFMNRLVPGIMPQMDAHLPFSSEMKEYYNQILFDEEYFDKRQAVCQAIRVVDLKNYPWHYGKLIFKFLLLKKLRKSPAFVRWYLSKHEANHAS